MGDSYEPCHENVLVYDRLPDPVKAEVDTALEEGAYETTSFLVEDELRYERVAGRSVDALRKDGTYYEARVESSTSWAGLGRTRTLSFEETAFTSDTPAELLVRNVTTDLWTGVIAIDDPADERLLEERLTIESYPREETPDHYTEADRDRIVQLPVTNEYGRYEATFDPDNGEPERVDVWFTMGYPPRRNRYAITDNGPEYDETLYGAIGRPGHPSTPCSWDDEGNLI
ncbi:hypothetical protein C445_00686 [Halobiforma lacisalsi AJ5]|nr:hypothetical protein C445_00686 [Halobiforma lacisalsi AJ5]